MASVLLNLRYGELHNFNGLFYTVFMIGIIIAYSGKIAKPDVKERHGKRKERSASFPRDAAY